MAKYLKLGPKATSFFDPTTQVLIRNNEVIKLERLPQSKKLTTALSQGHVVRASEEDYELFTSGKAPEKTAEAPKKEEPKVDTRLEMPEEEWGEYVEKSGFLKKDKTKIYNAKSRADAIALYDEINKKYEAE